MTEDTLRLNWDCLKRYMAVYEGFLNQQVLIVMRSHWDWYIRKLAGFVSFSRKTIPGQTITPKVEKDLESLGQREMPITSQLEMVRASTGLRLAMDARTIKQIKEMSLVRNLGLHNRWEVDQKYLDLTDSAKSLKVGELRQVTISELEAWQEALSQLLNETSVPIAKLYLKAPPYPAGGEVIG